MIGSQFEQEFLLNPNKYSRHPIITYNSDVDVAWEDIHTLGGAMNLLAGTGEHIHAVSGSAEDDPDKGAGVAGTGAHSIKVFYIDTAGALKSETIALNGAAAVISVATDIAFVLSAFVVDAGTGKAAAGQILIKNAGESANLMEIAAGQTRTYMGAFKVPTGYKYLICGIDLASCILATGAISLSYVRLVISNYSEVAGALTQVDSEHLLASVAGSRQIDFTKPLEVPAGSIFRIQGYGAAANNYIHALIDGFVVKA